MRLNRFLAQAGCGSRRACDALIREGRVTINGASVDDLATQVAPGDHVKVGNRLLRNEPPITAILHKPKGYLCTADDPEGRKTIYDLLPVHWPRVFYVGRLDADSEGLLVVTNDGDLGQRLTHPSYKLPKSYEVTLDKEFDFALAPKLLKGLFIEGKRAKLESIHRLSTATVKVVLTQGIKRQIRLMFLILGFNVRRLVRTEIGKLKLGTLAAGQWEILSQAEVKRCFGDGSEEKPVSRPPVRQRRQRRPGGPQGIYGFKAPGSRAPRPNAPNAPKTAPASRAPSKAPARRAPSKNYTGPIGKAPRPSSGTYAARRPAKPKPQQPGRGRERR
jgi:23S rRNA pseudouridine2605 synthase